ncbi:hypothetical protein ES705_27028 [subsurface metagenome]
MKHHSTGDFDFIVGTWSLSSDYFVSPPTSLYFSRPTADVAQAALLKHSISGAVEQGRIVSWFRSHTLGETRRNLFVFRNPSPDGSPAIVNSYAIEFSQTYIRWLWYTGTTTYDEIVTIYTALPYYITAGEWFLLRISWWNGVNPQSDPATIVRVEKFVEDVWTQFGDDVYDTNQRNIGNPVQRAGIGVHATGTGIIAYWDDTEFWKP